MILVVDDHEDTRRAVARLLRHSGYEAVTVADGEAALVAMRAHRPGLVLLDYNMPGMNGLDVLRAIRSTPELADLPVIMFTAIDGDVVMHAAQRLGVQGYVRKGALHWPSFLAEMRPFVGEPRQPA